MSDRRSYRAQTHPERDSTSLVVAGATLPFPAVTPDGSSARAAGPEHWAARLAELAAAGFNHVELTDTWLRVGDLDDSERASLRQAAIDAQLEVVAVGVIRSSVVDPVHGKSNLDYSHRSIDAAAELGARVVSVGLHQPLSTEQRRAWWFWSYRQPVNAPQDREQWDLAVERLRDLGRHAASVGLLLSLEMYEDTFLGTATSAVRLVNAIELDEVGLNPDTGNLVRVQGVVEPPMQVLAEVLPYANYWHVKNYTRMEDPQHGVVVTAPTSMELGVINYREGLRMAISAGYRGILTCEHYGGDGLSAAASNRDYLLRVLDQLQIEVTHL